MDQSEKIKELEERIQILEKKSKIISGYEANIIASAMQLARIELFKGVIESNGTMYYFPFPIKDSESFTRINVTKIINSAKQIIIEQTK